MGGTSCFLRRQHPASKKRYTHRPKVAIADEAEVRGHAAPRFVCRSAFDLEEVVVVLSGQGEVRDQSGGLNAGHAGYPAKALVKKTDALLATPILRHGNIQAKRQHVGGLKARIDMHQLT